MPAARRTAVSPARRVRARHPRRRTVRTRRRFRCRGNLSATRPRHRSRREQDRSARGVRSLHRLRPAPSRLRRRRCHRPGWAGNRSFPTSRPSPMGLRAARRPPGCPQIRVIDRGRGDFHVHLAGLWPRRGQSWCTSSASGPPNLVDTAAVMMSIGQAFRPRRDRAKATSARGAEACGRQGAPKTPTVTTGGPENSRQTPTSSPPRIARATVPRTGGRLGHSRGRGRGLL